MARPTLPQDNGTRVMTGARAVVFFNEAPIGFASGVNVSEEIRYEPVEVLDHLEVIEHAPVAYITTLSAQVFQTISAPGAPSTDDAPGSLKEQHIFPKFEEILRLQGVTFVVQDHITSKNIIMVTGVKAASQNFNYSPRGVVGQNVTFVAKRVFDSSEGIGAPVTGA